jgi:phosphatidylglycerophosphatase A
MNKKVGSKLKEMVATSLFVGYVPFIPGTMGTLVGTAIYIFLSPLIVFYYIAIAVLLVVAVWVSDYAEKHIFKIKDAPHIVIDETVGFLIAMISFPFDRSLTSIKFVVIGFILFRAFDILKPYPIRDSQKLEGGFGVVIDDVLAAVYTNLFLQFLRIMPFFSMYQ